MKSLKTSDLQTELAAILRNGGTLFMPSALEHKFISMLWEFPNSFLDDWWKDDPRVKCWELYSYDFSGLKLGDELIVVIPSYDDYRAYAAHRYASAIFDDYEPSKYLNWRSAASVTRHEFFNHINDMLANLHLHFLDSEAKYDYLHNSRGRVFLQDIHMDPRLEGTVHILPFNAFDRLASYLKDPALDLDIMLPRKANNGPGVIQKPNKIQRISKPHRNVGKGSNNG